MSDRPLLLDRFVPYRLSYTANLLSDLIANTYKALFGLTIPEWRIIAHVAEHGDFSQQDIVRRTRMDKVTVSRAAIALIERGLIRRIENPRDKRSHLLILTDPGHDLYAAIAPKALELEAKVFEKFDPAELKSLTDMLRRIDDAVLKELR